MNRIEKELYPECCPITGLQFFMEVYHPDHGYLPTYGGPYDSYTIPQQNEDGEWYRDRFDHDEGMWRDTEWIEIQEGIQG